MTLKMGLTVIAVALCTIGIMVCCATVISIVTEATKLVIDVLRLF